MRLIDDDALKEAVQGAINIMESHGISMIAASVPLAIIKGALTIPAIPVEWIMKWSNKRYRETQRDVSIVDVLEAWQKEQEAR